MAGGDGGFAVDIAGGGFVLDFADVMRTVLRVGFFRRRTETPEIVRFYPFRNKKGKARRRGELLCVVIEIFRVSVS